MKLSYAILMLPLLSFAMDDEKDYSLYDYNAISGPQRWRMYDAMDQLRRLHPTTKDARPFLSVASHNPWLAINITLDELKSAQLDYVPDRKQRAYRVAECAMLMAKVLDAIHDTTQITKAQIKRAWRSDNKDVSRMMALCRKHPEDAASIIESHKQKIRVRFARELVKLVW